MIVFAMKFTNISMTVNTLVENLVSCGILFINGFEANVTHHFVTTAVISKGLTVEKYHEENESGRQRHNNWALVCLEFS